MKKALCLILAFLLIISCFIMPATAFDGNDYDGGGGGGGYGGGGGGGGGWDDDWNSGGGSYSYLSDNIFENILLIVFVIVASVILKKIINKIFSGGSVSTPTPSSNQGFRIILPDRTAQIESIIKQNDPNFSASDFVTFVKEVYIDIETAWMKRDMTPVRPVLHENLYNTTVRQVQAKIDQGVVYHYESMVVNTAYLTSYARDAQFEYVTLYLNARRIDWQEDEKTGRILRGDKTTRWDMRYKMKFMRSAGTKTKQETSGVTRHNCPNCGAPLEITSSGKCNYCNSVVTTGQYSWVLCDYGTVRDDTVDEGIRS